MGLKQILDNAPEGATHYAKFEECFYKMKNDYWMWCAKGSNCFVFCDVDEVPPHDLRSLSDIKQILELQEENEKLKEQIREARRFLDSFIETEGSECHISEVTGEDEDCQIDFREAQAALDLLGCDDDYGIDTNF